MPGVRAIHLAAQWRMGVIDAFGDAGVFEQGDRDSYVAGVWFTCVTAALGDSKSATAALRRVEALPSEAGRDVQPESLWLAQASVALLEHRHADARAAMLQVVERFPLVGRSPAAFVWSLALAYELLPEHRDFFDHQPDLGPLYQRDLRLNHAHKLLVDRDDAAATRRIEFPDAARELLPALGSRFAAELLAGAWAHGHPSAEPMVHGFLDMTGEFGRAEFRAAADHAVRSIAKGSKEILESIPLAPSHVVELRLFGGTELQIDGVTVAHPDWRRERVRALLTFLVLHPETTRENVIAALWPDADTTAGRRSLRSTLNVLHAVLEPRRTAGDAPFFVRSVGQHLRLVTGDVLRVDVERFEAHLRDVDALVEAGTPSLTIEPLRAAVELYRGDLLPDSYDDWVVFARDRCRARYVAAAVRCSELLVATGRPQETIDLVTPVLAVEPWSEPAHRALIAAHVEHGDVAAARRSLATCHAALEDFGGPSEEPTLMLERRIMQR